MTTHKDLDKLYSDEEYHQFYEMMPVNSILRTRVKEYVDREFLYTKKFSKPFIYRSISQYIMGFSEATFEIMYRVPFKKLALFINHNDPIAQTAIKWRFTIGK